MVKLQLDKCGPKTREKIKEIVRTGTLQLLTELKDGERVVLCSLLTLPLNPPPPPLLPDPRVQARELFVRVWGIGPVTAEVCLRSIHNPGHLPQSSPHSSNALDQRLVRRGFRTLKDLDENKEKVLNDNQRVGLELFEDFEQRIPRSEVEAIAAVVSTECTPHHHCNHTQLTLTLHHPWIDQ